MERYYEIAGVGICIAGKEEEMYTDERLLEKFRTEKREDMYHFWFELADEFESPTGDCVYQDSSRRIYKSGKKEYHYIGSVKSDVKNAYIYVKRHDKEIFVKVLRKQVSATISAKIVLNALGLERMIVEEDGVILHASYIRYGNYAIVFTAPSQTGKSTQAELWNRLRGAEIINGDRAIICYTSGQAYVCGLPYSGSSKFCENETIALSAIVYLGQAPKTEISRLTTGQAFRRVWEGLSIAAWNVNDIEKAASTVQNIVNTVPVYYLECTADETAVIALEDALKKLERKE